MLRVLVILMKAKAEVSDGASCTRTRRRPHQHLLELQRGACKRLSPRRWHYGWVRAPRVGARGQRRHRPNHSLNSSESRGPLGTHPARICDVFMNHCWLPNSEVSRTNTYFLHVHSCVGSHKSQDSPRLCCVRGDLPFVRETESHGQNWFYLNMR